MAGTPPQLSLFAALFGAMVNFGHKVLERALSGLIEGDPVCRLAEPTVVIGVGLDPTFVQPGAMST
jgi:hypothetical protein